MRRQTMRRAAIGLTLSMLAASAAALCGLRPLRPRAIR